MNIHEFSGIHSLLRRIDAKKER